MAEAHSEQAFYNAHLKKRHYPSPERSMTQDEALRRLRLYRETGDATHRNAILEGNMRIVIGLSVKPEHQRPGISPDDLMHEACMGFLRGIERYDLSRAKLANIASYAYHEAKGHILDYLRTNCTSFYIPDKAYRAHKLLIKRTDKQRAEMQEEVPANEGLISDQEPAARYGAMLLSTMTFSDPVHTSIEAGESRYTRTDLDRILMLSAKLPNPDRALFQAYYGLSRGDYEKLRVRLGYSGDEADAIIEGCIRTIRGSLFQKL